MKSVGWDSLARLAVAGAAAIIATLAAGCVENGSPDEERTDEARSAMMSLDWYHDWECKSIEPTGPTVGIADGDITSLNLYAGLGGYTLRLANGGTYALKGTLYVAGNTRITWGGSSYPTIKVDAATFPTGDPLILVKGQSQVILEHLHLEPTDFPASAPSAIEIRGSDHVLVDDVSSDAIDGSSFRVTEKSSCIDLRGVHAEEVDYIPGGPICNTYANEAAGVNITDSNRVIVESSSVHASARAGIIALDSSDIAIWRPDLYDIGAGGCSGLGIGIGAKLSPSITSAAFNLWIVSMNHLGGYSWVSGPGILVEAPGAAGSQQVFVDSSLIDVDVDTRGIALCGGAAATGSDFNYNRVQDGDIKSNVSIAGAATNSCSIPGGCTFTSPCGTPSIWW